MSRYLRPPQFTVIRCLRPDQNGGGNSILHVDDILERLARDGKRHIVDMLARSRVLNTDQRHINVAGSAATARPDTEFLACIAVAGRPTTPTRLYDRHGATKGGHMELRGIEEEQLDIFIEECGSHPDLAVSVRLEHGDVLIFSNWRMLHARLPCEGRGRVTEICMGNEPATEFSLPDGIRVRAS
jgi:hypothetical protein